MGRLGLKKYARDKRGSIAVPFALAFLATLVGISIALDLSVMHETKRELQDITDTAALAGASHIDDSLNRNDIAQRALLDNFALTMGNSRSLTSQNIQFDDTAGTVTISASTTIKPNMISILGKRNYTISASSTAKASSSAAALGCLHVLDKTANGALYIHGNGYVGGDCEAQVNSSHATATKIYGNSQVRFNKICNAGGSSVSGNARVQAMPTNNCPTAGDPLAGLSVVKPSVPSGNHCDYNNYWAWGRISIRLYPGVYCGGLQVGGSVYVTFTPGTYIIKNGPLRIAGAAVVSFLGGEMVVKNAPAQISGNGRVRFYGNKLVIQNGTFTTSGNGSFTFYNPVEVLADNSPFNITGNGSLRADNIFIYLKGESATFDTRGDGRVTLKAPTTGTNAGTLIYQDPSITSHTTAYFQGSAYLYYKGNIYMPSWKVYLIGNGTFTSQGGSIVARTAEIGGSARVTLASGENTNAGSSGEVRLIH